MSRLPCHCYVHGQAHITETLYVCHAAVTWHEKDVGRFDVVDGRWGMTRAGWSRHGKISRAAGMHASCHQQHPAPWPELGALTAKGLQQLFHRAPDLRAAHALTSTCRQRLTTLYSFYKGSPSCLAVQSCVTSAMEAANDYLLPVLTSSVHYESTRQRPTMLVVPQVCGLAPTSPSASRELQYRTSMASSGRISHMRYVIPACLCTQKLGTAFVAACT